VIDAHVHAFPDVASGHAWQEAAGFEPVRPGTVGDLSSRMDRAGIAQSVLLLFHRSGHRYRALRDDPDEHRTDADLRAIVRDELRALNAWGCEVAARDPRFLPFIGVDPDYLDRAGLVDEISAGAARGARGVKIVPPSMRRYPDDDELDPVYAACVELGLTVLSQSGSTSGTPGPRGHFGRPGAWQPVLKRHPTLQVILAHLGRGHSDELVELVEGHPGAHTDLSLALGHPHERSGPDLSSVRRLIRRLGPGRVLFGTNYPIGDPIAYRVQFERLGLTAGERSAIGRENAERLLRLGAYQGRA
jgi:predicted TIM-barrel fold metal-dependent hydrolase